MLMAHMGMDADEAFALIRRQARSSGRRAADVAGEIIAGRLPDARA
jgi:AmiR/NasT family two-component response regulator